ncbi:hypothetical protein F5I97DRAFT_226018 [Phlebopus sp. FC_14]|nr:hypothetical protein F5I97DRAFT_226018 [Phlebopus sp. FC_14]
MAPETLDLNHFQEIFLKVTRERDHHRSMAVRLQSENNELQDHVDELVAQLLSVSRKSEKSQKKAKFNPSEHLKAVGPLKKDCDGTMPRKSACNNVNTGKERWVNSPSLDSPTGTSNKKSIYSQDSALYPFRRDPHPERQLTMSPERIEQCLAGTILPPTHDVPQPKIEVTRHFLSYIASTCACSTGRYRSIDPSGFVTMKHVLLGTTSAYFPISFGSPGLLLSCRKELFLNPNHVWSCFAPMPKISSKGMVYVGEYHVRLVDTMSLEEYHSQTNKAKTKNAAVMFDGVARKYRLKRYKQLHKVAVEVIEETFAAGKEKIHIFVLEYASYNTQFSRAIQARYNEWEAAQAHTKSGSPIEGDDAACMEEEREEE